MRVCVMGSGVGAWAAAFYAARAGAEVVVAPVEHAPAAEEQSFEWRGQRYPCFYEPIHSGDVALCAWLAEVGALRGQQTWHPSSFAIYDREAGRCSISPYEVLTRRLTPLARLHGRYGLWRLSRYAPLASRPTLEQWCRRHLGREASDRVLSLLRAALGEGVHELSARPAQRLVRSILSRRSGEGRTLAVNLPELLGLARALLVTSGVRVEPPGEVQWLRPGEGGRTVRVRLGRREEVFDAVIAAGPPGDWSKLFTDTEDEALHRARTAAPAGTLSVVALVRAPRRVPYREVLAHSEGEESLTWIHLPPGFESASGECCSPVYLTHRGRSHLPAFHTDDSSWQDRARRMLCDLSTSGFDLEVEELRVFRARSVDVPRLCEGQTRALPLRLTSCPVFLCTTACRPARPPGPEGAVMVAREVCETLGLKAAMAARPGAV